VRDERQTIKGLAAIKQWKAETARKYRHTVEPLASVVRDGNIVVTNRLTGNFPGSPVKLEFIFKLEGEKIASILPSGTLVVTAQFPPDAAFGRIRRGQSATVRLEGFPWAEFGSVPATVARVAHGKGDRRDALPKQRQVLGRELLAEHPPLARHGAVRYAPCRKVNILDSLSGR